MDSMKPGHITENQSFAINLLVRALKVKRTDCCWNDFRLMLDIMPKSLKAVHGLINDELMRYSQIDEFKKAERCRFKAGDTVVKYESYPTQLSKETVRQALINFRFCGPRVRSAR
jgi:hypothetical protein